MRLGGEAPVSFAFLPVLKHICFLQAGEQVFHAVKRRRGQYVVTAVFPGGDLRTRFKMLKVRAEKINIPGRYAIGRHFERNRQDVGISKEQYVNAPQHRLNHYHIPVESIRDHIALHPFGAFKQRLRGGARYAKAPELPQAEMGIVYIDGKQPDPVINPSFNIRVNIPGVRNNHTIELMAVLFRVIDKPHQFNVRIKASNNHSQSGSHIRVLTL